MREGIKQVFHFEGRTENARVRIGCSRGRTYRRGYQVKSLERLFLSAFAKQKDVSLRFSNLLRYYWG